MYKIGVDGGGTKTTATIYNDKMEVLGHFLGGPMNLQVVTRENIVAIFKNMLEFFKVSAENIEIGVGAAGAGRVEDIEKLENILKELKFKKYKVSNDAHIALLGTHGKKNGMLIISGTGSIGFSLNNEKIYRSGGLGHLLGDEGSGYSIGLDLLKAIFKALDKEVEINERVLRETFEIAKVQTTNSLLKWVYSNEKGEIAKLATVVLRNSKNEICKVIIDKNIEALKELVVDLKNKSKANKVGFAGGIIENDTPIRKGLLKELEKLDIEFVERKFTNDYGATLLLD
ncbi:MAG: N-acetylglucosamine kinase [Fusobacteriaceae bacterium]